METSSRFNVSSPISVINLEIIEQKLENNEKIIATLSASLTEHQIFNTAPPILKLFAKQLLTLTKNCDRTLHAYLYGRHPSLRVWLQLHNLTQPSIDAITCRFSFHDLYESNSEDDLRKFLVNTSEQDIHTIYTSFNNLKTFYKNNFEINPVNSTATTPKAPDLNNNPQNSPLLTAYSKLTEPSIQVATTVVSSSSSSELLNSSNSNESQLSSASNSSITNTTTPNSNTKSETVINTVESPLFTDQNLNSNQQQNIVKNLTFSPVLPLKTLNHTNQTTSKSNGHQKVTTPPPFRKLSTGSPYKNIAVNSHMHAVAVAAASAKNKLAMSDYDENKFQLGIDYNQNIHRSSSHESHLRNKITPGLPKVLGLNNRKRNSNSTSNNYVGKMANSSSENIYGDDCGSHGPSGQASPVYIQSPIRGRNTSNLFSDDYFKHNNNLAIPKSPKQFRDHRWSNTFKVSNCGVCQKKMIIGIKCKVCKFVKYVRIKNIKICELCRKPLWVGLKCKNCKFRCHKECEKKFSPICPSVFMAFLPPPTLINQSNNTSDTNLSNQQLDTQSISNTTTFPNTNNNINNLILHSSSLISSSSSAGSSTVPSPGLITNTNNINDLQSDTNYQHSWPSSASKVARVANKIVNSINSVSTPKSNRKPLPPQFLHTPPLPAQLNHNSPKIFFSNESPSSSCNSSGPNSPNYFNKLQQQQYAGLQETSNNKNITLNTTDKKSSSSSNSISSGSNNLQQKTNSFFNYTQPNNNNNNNTILSPVSANKFFVNPTIKRTTSIDSNQLDDSVDSISLVEQGNAANLSGITETGAVKLDFKKSNNSTVIDSNYDGETDLENTNMNYSEYEGNDQDMNQLNFSHDFKQFNITYDEITDKVEIGRGRFGCVYKAQWHGPHAVKEIDFDENLTADSRELNNFKQELLNLKKTRHANLILFVGACVEPPKCAIVMSLCRGINLYKYLHTESYQKPNFDWKIDIATQIAQGMGYLHNKQMIHKDLRSKNIFIDGCKAVIADFGLYSITHLCKKMKRTDLLPITKECLFYMAPELVRLLGKSQIDGAFSQASDVFSFGTVWYELFCFEYPFQSNSTETVIYLIGNGLKNISPTIQIPKEFKNILLKCWSKDASARPNFSHLLETFRAIPKQKKLFRSPSHPGYVGRSLEALDKCFK